MPAPRLSDDEIRALLKSHPDWEWAEDRIKCALEFETFMGAIAFINRVAPLAEKADHHPEIFNVYNRVELVLTTHDSSGLTHKDFDLAAQIDAL